MSQPNTLAPSSDRALASSTPLLFRRVRWYKRWFTHLPEDAGTVQG
jgi:hypothetical protein